MRPCHPCDPITQEKDCGSAPFTREKLSAKHKVLPRLLLITQEEQRLVVEVAPRRMANRMSCIGSRDPAPCRCCKRQPEGTRRPTAPNRNGKSEWSAKTMKTNANCRFPAMWSGPILVMASSPSTTVTTTTPPPVCCWKTTTMTMIGPKIYRELPKRHLLPRTWGRPQQRPVNPSPRRPPRLIKIVVAWPFRMEIVPRQPCLPPMMVRM